MGSQSLSGMAAVIERAKQNPLDQNLELRPGNFHFTLCHDSIGDISCEISVHSFTVIVSGSPGEQNAVEMAVKDVCVYKEKISELFSNFLNGLHSNPPPIES